VAGEVNKSSRIAAGFFLLASNYGHSLIHIAASNIARRDGCSANGRTDNVQTEHRQLSKRISFLSH